MKTTFFKRIACLALIATPVFLFAQDDATADSGPELVKSTFENSMHINNQTVITHDKGYLDIAIQHRFGVIDKPSDLYGIYAPSNIRLYFGYGITKKLAVGFAPTKDKQLYDFNLKYAILKQMTKGMPVSLTAYCSAIIKGGDQSTILNAKNEYSFSNRMAYYTELMVARKFNKNISLQAGFNYAHYNIIDQAKMGDNFDLMGVNVIGRYKFSPQGSFLFEFDNPLTTNMPVKPMPNLGLGVEFSTGYHQFQIFVCNAKGLVSPETKYHNHNDPFMLGTPGYMIGFNMTRQWGLGN